MQALILYPIPQNVSVPTSARFPRRVEVFGKNRPFGISKAKKRAEIRTKVDLETGIKRTEGVAQRRRLLMNQD